MFVKKLIEEGTIKPNADGEIRLGTANGWGDETSAVFDGLRKLQVGHSREKNLGRCYNEYSFDIVDEGEKYVVVYSVDSGD
jgi:hypothetical protein